MSHTDPTYVIFDGDNDQWAYRFMRGWKANERINFDFKDAHDLDNMTARAQGEAYVKSQLLSRLKGSEAVIVLIGESTKNLYKFVRWEMEQALKLDLPIIGVNLNNSRRLDAELCPPIIREKCAVHVSFKLKIIQYALDQWPSEYRNLSAATKNAGDRYYADSVYQQLGL